jgi:hypothetical protein
MTSFWVRCVTLWNGSNRPQKGDLVFPYLNESFCYTIQQLTVVLSFTAYTRHFVRPKELGDLGGQAAGPSRLFAAVLKMSIEKRNSLLPESVRR